MEITAISWNFAKINSNKRFLKLYINIICYDN